MITRIAGTTMTEIYVKSLQIGKKININLKKSLQIETSKIADI